MDSRAVCVKCVSVEKETRENVETSANLHKRHTKTGDTIHSYLHFHLFRDFPSCQIHGWNSLRPITMIRWKAAPRAVDLSISSLWMSILRRQTKRFPSTMTMTMRNCLRTILQRIVVRFDNERIDSTFEATVTATTPLSTTRIFGTSIPQSISPYNLTITNRTNLKFGAPTSLNSISPIEVSGGLRARNDRSSVGC